jgi:uncharacterized protein (DUF1684 family)
MSSASYAADVDRWFEKRINRLAAADGWLNIVGLWWLDDGPIRVGSSAANDAVLPHGPDILGMAESAGDQFAFTFVDPELHRAIGKPVKNQPFQITAGDFLLEAVLLAGRMAFRVRDRRSTGQAITIERFPVDPLWRIVAGWIPLDEPVHTTVDTMIGLPTEVTVTHKAVFDRDGQHFELLPTHGTPAAPQFVIRDLTAGNETYAACRFLFGEPLESDTIVLDFNKAINPPCAFSSFAVCPLPPPQNVIPLRIEAGERKWSDGH